VKCKRRSTSTKIRYFRTFSRYSKTKILQNEGNMQELISASYSVIQSGILQRFDESLFYPCTANIVGRFGKNSEKRQRTGTMIEES